MNEKGGRRPPLAATSALRPDPGQLFCNGRRPEADISEARHVDTLYRQRLPLVSSARIETRRLSDSNHAEDQLTDVMST